MPKLKSDVTVADEGGALVTLNKGTSYSHIKKLFLDQLAPGHFDGELEDWRSEERQQADRDVLAAKVAEQQERMARKAERVRAQQLKDAKQRIEADQKLVAELEQES